MNMNIFKTFEEFLKEPLSILKKSLIQLVNVQTDFAVQPTVSAEFLDKKTQITVVNSNKMYNLLQTALYKQQIKSLSKQFPQMRGNQVVLGRLLERR